MTECCYSSGLSFYHPSGKETETESKEYSKSDEAKQRLQIIIYGCFNMLGAPEGRGLPIRVHHMLYVSEATLADTIRLTESHKRKYKQNIEY